MYFTTRNARCRKDVNMQMHPALKIDSRYELLTHLSMDKMLAKLQKTILSTTSSIKSSDNYRTGFWPPGSLHTLGADAHIQERDWLFMWIKIICIEYIW